MLVIGGGMAGVLCAFLLQQAGAACMVLEGGRVGGGVTGNTTAKITSQHGLIYAKLLRQLGMEKARMYLEANEKALAYWRELCNQKDCDFEEKSAFVFSRKDRPALEEEAAAVNRLGISADLVERIPLPVETVGAVRFDHQAQFHPVKFLANLSKGLPIYENSFVQEVGKTWAKTAHGKVDAEKIIIASHFPFLNKHGSYFLKLYQHRSYVIALENAAQVEGMYLEETIDGLSFRNQEKFLLVGGGDHRTGVRGGNWNVLRQFAKEAYPRAVERYHWATQDCMSLDAIPYIGPYSKSTSNLYVATGFNKWGMTGAMVAAMVLCDLAMGRRNEWEAVFTPSRSILQPQLLFNGLHSLGGYLYPSGRRCPHLGCVIKWNPAEHSWDCPCHGSRFDEGGKLLDGPAMGGTKVE